MTTTDTVRDGANNTTPLFKREAGWQVFMMLRTVFIVAPLLFGIDKFFNLMVKWPVYLAPIVTDVIPVTPQQFMYVVGVIEIVAAICVFLFPRFGSVLVAAWLAGIILNLLILGSGYDVALRDFGLLVAALALFRLSFVYSRPRVKRA
ncbi:DoxX family membrane protein [Parafrigoribacterium mesophilum]|uniref:hypothetical protein n=1 Tax=Parafrigoribacterium mesophilum TaxID=433646 RepID=UPI0031FC7ED0